MCDDAHQEDPSQAFQRAAAARYEKALRFIFDRMAAGAEVDKTIANMVAMRKLPPRMDGDVLSGPNG